MTPPKPATTGDMWRRFGASIVALAAAGSAVVLVATLVRGLAPITESGTTASPPAGAAAAPARTRPHAGFPAPPPGAAVFAAEAGQDGLGLAVVPGKRATGLQASIIDANGAGVPNLTVAFLVSDDDDHARRIAAVPCGAGCYRATIRSSPSPRRVVVHIDRHRPEALAFRLPRPWPPRPARMLVLDAARVWRGLHSLVFHDSLSSGGPITVQSVWRIVAPNRLSYRVEHGGESVIIGDQRWDRPSGDGAWQVKAQLPVQQPAPSWVRVADARVLGTVSIDGKPAWRISFFDPGTPGWFSILVDHATLHTLRVHMVAPGHFMRDTYGPFDAPITISPPRSPR